MRPFWPLVREHPSAFSWKFPLYLPDSYYHINITYLLTCWFISYSLPLCPCPHISSLRECTCVGHCCDPKVWISADTYWTSTRYWLGTHMHACFVESERIESCRSKFWGWRMQCLARTKGLEGLVKNLNISLRAMGLLEPQWGFREYKLAREFQLQVIQ